MKKGTLQAAGCNWWRYRQERYYDKLLIEIRPEYIDETLLKVRVAGTDVEFNSVSVKKPWD